MGYSKLYLQVWFGWFGCRWFGRLIYVARSHCKHDCTRMVVLRQEVLELHGPAPWYPKGQSLDKSGYLPPRQGSYNILGHPSPGWWLNCLAPPMFHLL